MIPNKHLWKIKKFQTTYFQIETLKLLFNTNFARLAFMFVLINLATLATSFKATINNFCALVANYNVIIFAYESYEKSLVLSGCLTMQSGAAYLSVGWLFIHWYCENQRIVLCGFFEGPWDIWKYAKIIFWRSSGSTDLEVTVDRIR